MSAWMSWRRVPPVTVIISAGDLRILSCHSGKRHGGCDGKRCPSSVSDREEANRYGVGLDRSVWCM